MYFEVVDNEEIKKTASDLASNVLDFRKKTQDLVADLSQEFAREFIAVESRIGVNIKLTGFQIKNPEDSSVAEFFRIDKKRNLWVPKKNKLGKAIQLKMDQIGISLAPYAAACGLQAPIFNELTGAVCSAPGIKHKNGSTYVSVPEWVAKDPEYKLPSGLRQLTLEEEKGLEND